MRRLLALLCLVGLIAALFAAPLSLNAQGNATYTITEQELNAYPLPASLRSSVRSFNIDLQPERAVLSARVVYQGLTLNTVSVWQPSLRDGRLSWRAISATVNGTPLSPDQLATLNSTVRGTLNRAVRSYLNERIGGRYRIERVRITDDAIILTVALGR